MFVLAGGLSAVIEIITFKIFTSILPGIWHSEQNFYGVHFPLSNILSTSCGILSNYFFSIWFVFQRGKHSKKREFFYFMVFSFAATLAGLLFFQFFYTQIFTNAVLDVGFFIFSAEMISKILAIVCVSFFSYVLKKKLIFNG